MCYLPGSVGGTWCDDQLYWSLYILSVLQSPCVPETIYMFSVLCHFGDGELSFVWLPICQCALLLARLRFLTRFITQFMFRYVSLIYTYFYLEISVLDHVMFYVDIMF